MNKFSIFLVNILDLIKNNLDKDSKSYHSILKNYIRYMI